MKKFQCIEGNLLDKLIIDSKYEPYGCHSICSDSQYLYLVWNEKDYRYKMSEFKQIENSKAWNLNFNEKIYGMQIIENYLYMLTSRDVEIYDLLQNCIFKKWRAPICSFNMIVDENFIYVSSFKTVIVYDKQGNIKTKEIWRTTKQRFCGIALDKEYLYVCEIQETKSVLVFNKETNVYTREIGRNILIKPTSIYWNQNFLYVWDFKCITVLSTDIDNEEFVHKILAPKEISCPGLEYLGNFEAIEYLGNQICIVNDRLYVAVPRSQSILMFE